MKKILLLLPILLLSGCFNGASNVQGVSIKLNNGEYNQYYSPEEVELRYTYKSLQEETGHILMPSVGDVNVLVVPLIIKGYEENATDTFLDILEQSFNGDEVKGGYESLSSYYEKASYGKLKIHADILPWIDFYDAGKINDSVSLKDVTSNQIHTYLNNVMDYVYTMDLDFDKYDLDKDGYLDQVYFIYSSYDYQNLTYLYYQDRNVNMSAYNENFWAYTVTTTNLNAHHINPSKPQLSTYTFMSFDMFLDGYAPLKKINYGGQIYQVPVLSESNDISTHTLIHETGHALGLKDYYSYGDSNYGPMGRLTMMDYNVGDLDAYSKMCLGWLKPYIVYGNANIDLKNASENENQAIVILPEDSINYKSTIFDPFDEYILIEKYECVDINYKDKQRYINYRVPMPSRSGYKIYHVDSRKFIIEEENNKTYIRDYKNETDLDSNEFMILPITNTESGERSETASYQTTYLKNSWDEVRLIESSRKDTFSSGGYFTNDTLFTGGDRFSITRYSAFFENERLNNGMKFNYTISF